MVTEIARRHGGTGESKNTLRGLCYTLLCVCCPAFGQIQTGAIDAIQDVFSGNSTLTMLVTNNSDTPAMTELSFQTYQLSSATAAPLPTSPPTKIVRLHPRQVAVEKLDVQLPEVQAPTRFEIVVSEDGKRSGRISVRAYPSNLLQEVRKLAEAPGIEIFDPNKRLQPLLRGAGISVNQIENIDASDPAKFLIVHEGAAESRKFDVENDQYRRVLILRRPESHLNTVEIQDKPRSRVVTAPLDLLSNLSQSPRSQLNFARVVNLTISSRKSSNRDD